MTSLGWRRRSRRFFSEADWQLCVLHAVREALNKTRKKDWETLAEALKKTERTETKEEAEEALRSLRERWGEVLPRSWSGGRLRLALF